MRTYGLTLLFAATLAAPAAADWKKMDGQRVPAIDAKEWWNVDNAPAVAELRGKVYLLEFFATW